MKELTAAGGVLFKVEGKALHVLLIHRRGVWDLPKGKLEEGESIEECAIREVEEEVGCATPENMGQLAHTYHQYKEGRKSYGKTTYWYAMTTTTEHNFTPEAKENIEKVSWFTLEEAIGKVGFENLENVLVSFKEWHSKTY